MSDTEKIARLKILLNPNGNAAVPSDAVLGVYLSTACDEILAWLYNDNVPADVLDVPPRYENIQIQSVIVGYSLSGNEGQTGGSENGISRSWSYPTMVEFIRTHIQPYAVIV